MRNAISPIVPQSMIPYTDYITWVSIPQGLSGRFSILGYCQWRVPRSAYVLRTRYARAAIWTPLNPNDTSTLNQINNSNIRGSLCYSSGSPPSTRARRNVLNLPFGNSSTPDLLRSTTNNSTFRRQSYSNYRPQRRRLTNLPPLSNRYQSNPSVSSNPGYERFRSDGSSYFDTPPDNTPVNWSYPAPDNYTGPSYQLKMAQQRQFQRNRYLSQL